MLKVGAQVIYGQNGVCEVVDLREERFFGKKQLYYVLCPCACKSTTLFLPADDAAEQKVKRVLTAEEVEALIQSLPAMQTIWIEDDKERAETYKRILDDCDREALACLVKTLFMRKEMLAAEGKKLKVTDDAFFKQSQKMLLEEFAAALRIEVAEVIVHIEAQIG